MTLAYYVDNCRRKYLSQGVRVLVWCLVGQSVMPSVFLFIGSQSTGPYSGLKMEMNA